MESRSFKQRIVEKKSLCWYIFGILFTILYSMVIFGLFDYDFQVPLWYQDADNLNALMFLKRTKDGFFVTDMQGAPFYAVNDFPLYGDTLNLLIQKVLLDITGSIGMTVNLFYLGLYPVTFCTSFYVMRKCEVVNWAAFVSSILYTFLPYRLLRSTKHLYLSNYCFIPILVYICILIYTKPSQKISKHDLIFFALMVPCLALCGIYYAFISCFLIFLILAISYLKNRKISRLGVGCGIGILLCVLIAMIPTLWNIHNQGPIPVPITRSPVESEWFGLKIARLFIPITTHGIGILQTLFQDYVLLTYPGAADEPSEYLGIVGIIGFLFALALLFKSPIQNKRLEIISRINLATILLSTVGGFGTLFAVLISPQIRGYSRFSVVVAFCAIATFAVLITTIWQRAGKSPVLIGIILALCCLSLYDQTITGEESRLPDPKLLKTCEENFYSDRDFVKRIESYASDDAMIYQYPYLFFPEMGGYATVRGYIHSDKLRWSYGDYRGRTADVWQETLSGYPIEYQIKVLALVGFEGIYIDTAFYSEEDAENMCAAIESITGEDTYFTSKNSRLLFYGLNNYRDRLRQICSDQDIEKIKDALLTSLMPYNATAEEYVQQIERLQLPELLCFYRKDKKLYYIGDEQHIYKFDDFFVVSAEEIETNMEEISGDDRIDTLGYFSEMAVTDQIMKQADGSIHITAGQIMYGPYIHLDSGKYLLSIKVETEKNVNMNFTNNNGSELLGTFELEPGDNTVEFTLETPVDTFESTIYGMEGNPISVKDIKLTKVHE